ncbi:MAG TPA: hypothetical protein VF772_02485 [Terriglobales bacterium]
MDRLDSLMQHLDCVESDSPQTALLHAQVASNAHRFSEARSYLAKTAASAEQAVSAKRLSLSIDQACGDNLEAALETRQRMADESGRAEDLVPLGALLADLGGFDEADEVYERALRHYRDTSPFGIAWVCFQRGVLWGELVSQPQPSHAATWYRRAIDYLPCYVRARVHLAETCLELGRPADAESLLVSVVNSGDPEVNWRLADALFAMGRQEEAEAQMSMARSGFDSLLRKYSLAFADHASEFYLSRGKDYEKALELAQENLANRPTPRAFELAHKAAVQAGEISSAYGLVQEARKKWGDSDAFRLSSLAAANHADGSLEGLC